MLSSIATFLSYFLQNGSFHFFYPHTPYRRQDSDRSFCANSDTDTSQCSILLFPIPADLTSEGAWTWFFNPFSILSRHFVLYLLTNQCINDSHALMFAEMPVTNTSLILQIPDSNRLVRT